MFSQFLKKISIKIDKKIFSLLLKKIDNLSLTDLDERRRNFIFKYHRNDYKIEKDKIVFIHVPKTGGATLRDFFEKKIDNWHVFEKKSEHNPVSIICPPQQYKYITIVRDPIARVYSYYQMSKNHSLTPGHKLAKKSLTDFLRFSWQAKNLYCQYYTGNVGEIVNREMFLQAKENLKDFYYVGDFKTYEESFKELCIKLNVVVKNIPHINTGKYDSISNEEELLIKHYNQFDVLLYNEFFKEKLKNKS